LEIFYDDDEVDKRQLLKVTTNIEDMEAVRSREREELVSLIQSVKDDHQEMIVKLKEKVKYIREIKKGVGRTNRMSDEEIKKLVSMEKRRLIQFRSDKGNGDRCDPPEQKRRKSMNDHKSRCSDLKVQFFQKTKEMLDKEEAEGLIASWERVYKYIINKHVNIKVNDEEPVMKEPSKMLNELSKAVDLEELMNEEQNVHRAWLTI
jgi:flagellin-specific chaperone FliS